jgi:transposase
MLRVGNITLSRGGDLMRFDTTPHPFDCGIDLHARTMSLCRLSQDGEGMVHRTMPAAPEPFLQAVAPSRDGLVVAVACLFPWYGLADFCAREGMPFVLGHALYMQAIHGGKAQNDKLAAQNIAVLRRGGRLPQASVSPAAMRAPRDLLRRRVHLTRKRAERLGHLHNTNSQDHLPESGMQSASKANRDGGAERFPEPAVQQSIVVDRALRGSYDQLLRAVALTIVPTAKQHDAQTLDRRQSVPGIGKILRRGLLYAIHDIRRFPRGQDCVASCQLGKCAQEAAGKRSGTSGATSGHA